MEKINNESFLKNAYAFQLALESGFILENSGITNWRGSKISVPVGVFKPAFVKNVVSGLPVANVQNANIDELNVVYYKVNPNCEEESKKTDGEVVEIPLIDVLIYFSAGKEINDIDEISDLLTNTDPLMTYKKSVAEKVKDNADGKDLANCYDANDIGFKYCVDGVTKNENGFKVIPFKIENLSEVVNLLYKFNNDFAEISEGLYSSIKNVNEIDRNEGELASLIDMDYVTTIKKMIDSGYVNDVDDIVEFVYSLNIMDDEKRRIVSEASKYLSMKDIYNPEDLNLIDILKK